MLGLRAVIPDGLRVGYTDCVCHDLVLCGKGSVGGHEAGEEGVGLVGHNVLDRYAWVVEGGLDDGVVLRVRLG